MELTAALTAAAIVNRHPRNSAAFVTAWNELEDRMRAALTVPTAATMLEEIGKIESDNAETIHAANILSCILDHIVFEGAA